MPPLNFYTLEASCPHHAIYFFVILSPIVSEIKRVQKKDLAVKRTKAGLGLVTLVPIEKGDLIIEYTGEKISSDEADRRGGKYLFTIDKNWVIDGKGRENLARYINHACRPNCETEVDERKKKVFIYARRNINPGEELNYNYGKEYWDEHIKPFGCKCSKCLGN